MSQDRLDVDRLEKMGLWIRLMELLNAGFPDHEVREKMRLTAAEYEKLRREAFQFEADKIRRRTNEEIYVEYLVNQAQCVKDLTTLAQEFTQRKNHSALVSAIRARSEIYDKMIKLGQDFGFVAKAPERSEHRFVALVANMNTDELRQLAVGELKNVDRLMQMFGDKGILDVEPGKIHRALPPAKPEVPKRAKAKQNTVHKGRRIVRERDLED